MKIKIQQINCNIKSFLKNIDDENNRSFLIYAYLTSDQTKFLYIFDKKEEKKELKIKNFFNELHYQFAKVLMNPLYKINSAIKYPEFRKTVKILLDSIN
jgi:hypothetical protein